MVARTLRCPRCRTHVQVDEGRSPQCPACGFGSTAASPPVPPPVTPSPASPLAPAPTVVAPPAIVGAGAGRRALGILIDVAIRLVVLVPFTIYMFGAYGVKTETAGGVAWNIHGLPAAAWMAGWFGFTLLYHVGFEVAGGASPGKFAVGTRVVDAAGNRIPFGRALARNALRPVDALLGYLVGFVSVLASGQRQRLGDMAAKAFVVAKAR